MKILKYLIILLLVLSACSSSDNVVGDSSTMDASEDSSNDGMLNLFQKTEPIQSESLIGLEELVETWQEYKIIEIGSYSEYSKNRFHNALNAQASDITRTVSGISNQVISSTNYERFMEELGLVNEDKIVIYTSGSMNHGARLLWTMKYYGHENVKLFDGDKSTLEKYLSNEQIPNIISSDYKVEPTHIKDYNVDSFYVNSKLNDQNTIILDVRSAEEFATGHIPGAINIDWTQSLNPDNTLKSLDELKSIWNLDNKEIIVYCRSGMRASHAWFVLKEILNFNDVKVFDGSMIEWETTDYPIES